MLLVIFKVIIFEEESESWINSNITVPKNLYFLPYILHMIST